MKYKNMRLVLSATVLVLLSVFGSLALIANNQQLLTVDKLVSTEVQKEEPVVFPIISQIISYPGEHIPAALLLITVFSYFIYRRYYREALFVMSVIGIDALSLFFKRLVDRPRPTPGLANVLQQNAEASFPSGHVVHYIAFFGFIVFLLIANNRLRIRSRLLLAAPLIFLIATVPFSRIYLGAHWLSDVLGGFLLGTSALIIMILLYTNKKFLPSIKAKIRNEK